MHIKRIMELTRARCISGDPAAPVEIKFGFAADLMSDVLLIETEHLLLITGQCSVQTIRTAAMSNIGCILLVRNKKATSEMTAVAKQSAITLLESPFSMFRAVGELAKEGIEPLF